MEISKIIPKMKKDYFSPTSPKWRKLGDALLGVSTTITGFAIYEEAKWVAIVALLTGVVGKFLTNLFGED
jgi:hypothetical protein